MSKLVYLAMYSGKKLEINDAKDKWDAVQKARKTLKVPKSKQGLLSVELVSKDGKQITSTITS